MTSDIFRYLLTLSSENSWSVSEFQGIQTLPQELLEHFQERRLLAVEGDRGRSKPFEGVKTRISKILKNMSH